MAEKKEKQEEKKKISVPTRGRIFQGVITKKFPKRVVIELERTVKIPKFERFIKKRTRLHARLPEGINAGVGDSVKIQECRPLSKIINFLVIGVIKPNQK